MRLDESSSKLTDALHWWQLAMSWAFGWLNSNMEESEQQMVFLMEMDRKIDLHLTWQSRKSNLYIIRSIASSWNAPLHRRLGLRNDKGQQQSRMKWKQGRLLYHRHTETSHTISNGRNYQTHYFCRSCKLTQARQNWPSVAWILSHQNPSTGHSRQCFLPTTKQSQSFSSWQNLTATHNTFSPLCASSLRLTG